MLLTLTHPTVWLARINQDHARCFDATCNLWCIKQMSQEKILASYLKMKSLKVVKAGRERGDSYLSLALLLSLSLFSGMVH